jgi:amidase
VITPEGDEHPFLDLLAYIAPATLTGCPATVALAGLSQSGLPVGVQIMGSYLEDATPLRFAGLLSRKIGGFQAPVGYERVS